MGGSVLLVCSHIRWLSVLLWDPVVSFGHDPCPEPYPCSHKYAGLRSELQIWEGAREEEGIQGEMGVCWGVTAEGSEYCADSGFVPMATPLLFPCCWKCRARQETECMLIFLLPPYSNPNPTPLHS